MTNIKDQKTTIRREVTEQGQTMVLEIGPTGVYAYPKGQKRSQRVQISVLGSWQSRLVKAAAIPSRTIGMTPRRRSRKAVAR